MKCPGPFQTTRAGIPKHNRRFFSRQAEHLRGQCPDFPLGRHVARCQVPNGHLGIREIAPQRGRYREFVQCDVDTVGSSGMLADAEILGLT